MAALVPRGTLRRKDRVFRILLHNLEHAGALCSSVTQLIPACEDLGQELNLLVFSALFLVLHS